MAASLLPAGTLPARREPAGAADPRSRHPGISLSVPARAVGAAPLGEQLCGCQTSRGTRALFVREAPRWCECCADGALGAHAV